MIEDGRLVGRQDEPDDVVELGDLAADLGVDRGELRGEQIPIPSRMMAISDIYDALTASDRPYKRAMPTEKALDILAADVKRGQLDSDLFTVFVEARVWMLPPPRIA